jgi:DNA-binding PadR family transcriptional regulator
MQNELEEYLDELAYSWSETFKKSMVTYVVLSILAKNNLWSKEIHEAISSVTSSKISLDEKSLHRTLRRLEKYGLISHKKIDGQKTGAERKVYSITEDGKSFLDLINNNYLFNL